MNHRHCFFLLFLLTLLALLPQSNYAAPTAHQSELLAAHEISQDSSEAKIKAINNRADLNEALKTKVLGFYRSAIENLRNDEWFQVLAKNYLDSISKTPLQIQEQQTKFNDLQAQPVKNTELINKLSAEQIEQRLLAEKTNLNSLDTQIVKLESDLSVQTTRADEIRLETETAKQALNDSEQTTDVFKLLAESELERDARQAQLKTLQSKLTSQLKMLGLEALSHPERMDLLKSQLQLLNLQKQNLVATISELEKNFAQRQQSEAQSLQNRLSKIEKNSLNKHPLIQQTTKDNIRYSQQLQTLSAELERLNQNKEQLESRSVEIDSDFKSAEKKISLAGLSPVLGKILREQRNKLTNIDKINQQDDIQSDTAKASLAEFKLESRLKQLVDIDAELQKMMTAQVQTTLNQDTRSHIESELHLLLNEQKDLLNKLTKIYASYLRSLGDYDFAKQQLIKQATKYALYLDERLLWVPSSEAINTAYFVNLYDAVKWLISFNNWKMMLVNLFSGLWERYFLALLSLLAISSLLRYRETLREQITRWDAKIGGLYHDKFYFTPSALAYTLIMLLPVPLSLWICGVFLESATHPADFSLAVAKGLQAMVIPLFFLQLFYSLFAPNGIVTKHFNWQQDTTCLLHRQIAWVRSVILPSIFLMNMANASQNTLHSDSLGRLALIAIMLVVMMALAKILQPERGVLKSLNATKPESWIARLRYVWYGGVIVAPLMIIGFALTGYYLSALELEQKLILTLRLGFVMIIVYELVLRWLTVVNRQLALKNSQQKRKAAQLNTQHPFSETAENQEVLLLDIPKINQQTTKLLNVFIVMSLFAGIWMIWKNILPAFSFLDQIVLWEHLVSVDKQEVSQAITLGNLLLSGIDLFVILLAVNNLPGLLEVLILRRFSFQQGSRYAINQLSRYVLIAIGTICIANELGGSWSQVQWLIAALSVGLGFGLQEIFANLVSGIILLFERPIRVGDTVTIGDISGKVSQIQMRATHIVDADEKELIVPNKSFITDKLVNWALSSQITGLVIPLGISYGSDVDFAHKVISDTVLSTPCVLAEPKPSVYFVKFGESALEFSIRVYVSELSHRMPVTHDLHLRLYKALIEHNIEIAVPQREVHIRQEHVRLAK